MRTCQILRIGPLAQLKSEQHLGRKAKSYDYLRKTLLAAPYLSQILRFWNQRLALGFAAALEIPCLILRQIRNPGIFCRYCMLISWVDFSRPWKYKRRYVAPQVTKKYLRHDCRCTDYLLRLQVERVIIGR